MIDELPGNTKGRLFSMSVLRLLLCAILIVQFIPGLGGTIAKASDTYIVNDDFEGADLPSAPTNTENTNIGNYNVSITSNKGNAYVFDPNANYAQVVDDPLRAKNKVLKIVDNSNGSSSQGGSTRIYNNSFPKQTTGTVAVEYDFMGDSFGSGTPSNRFRLTNAGVNTSLASIETYGNKLVYRTGPTSTDVTTLLDSLQPKTWYHVKIEADLDQKKYTVTISGGDNTVVKDLPFYQSVTDFGDFDVNTGNSSTSTIYLDNVQIYNVQAAPEAPTGLSAQANNTNMNLAWNAVSGASSYNVKRSNKAAGPFETIQSNVTGTSFQDSGLTENTTYYYVVSAVNTAGESADSTTVNATTTSAPAVQQDYLVNDNFDTADWSANKTTATSAAIGNYDVSIASNKGTAWVFNPDQNYAQVVTDPAKTDNKALLLVDQQDGSATAGGLTSVTNNSFSKQSLDHTVVTEFDFRADSFGNGTRFRLTNAGINTVLASLEFSSNKLVYRMADGTTPTILDSLQANQWYHVKITADLQNSKYDVTVSGAGNADVHNLPFVQPVTDFGAINVNTGNSSTSNLYLDNVQIYVPSIVPAAPTGVQSTPGNTQIKLSWSAASGASSYNVKRSTSPDGPFTTVKSGVTDLMFSDSDLTNETTYYYVVSGVNSVGEGQDSTPVSVTPSSSIPLPSAPTVKATAKDSSVSLSWDPVDSADSYIVKRSTTADGTYEVVAPNLTSPSFLDTKLSDGQTYYYEVQSVGVGGTSQDSTPVSVQPNAPLAQPADLVAKVGDHQVDVTWSKVDGATSYNVKRSTVNGGPYTTVATGVTDSAYSDKTADNGTAYYYVVTAIKDGLESMISNQVKATPFAIVSGAPTIPNGFSAKAEDGKVVLSWKKVDQATSYTVKRSTTSGGPYTTVADHLTDTAYTDKDVTNGTEYYYVVTASNSAGESGSSSELAAIPAKTIVVAQDGTGDFTTVQAAVNSIPADNSSRIVIYIKNGTYNEKVSVTQPNVSFVGESRDGVVIVWGDYGGSDGKSGNVGSTFASQTVGVTGDSFTASNLTIKNSATPRASYGTAVALSVKSDQAVFDNVKILSNQDTLYNGSGRQYFHNSYIEGDVDFIFGEAPAVVFDNSEIHSVGTNGYVTAAAQANPTDVGYVFLNSRLTMDPGVTKVYLGRPWKNYAKTTYINTWMDSHIVPDGWSIWSGTDNHLKASYNEYNSTGPGANPQARVDWSNQLTAEEASNYTLTQVFGGWDPSQVVAMPGMPAAADDISLIETAVDAPVVGNPVIGNQDTVSSDQQEQGTATVQDPVSGGQSDQGTAAVQDPISGGQSDQGTAAGQSANSIQTEQNKGSKDQPQADNSGKNEQGTAPTQSSNSTQAEQTNGSQDQQQADDSGKNVQVTDPKQINNENADGQSTAKIGNSLPKTSTNIGNLVVSGFLLIALGAAVLFYRRKKTSNM
jgi:LPXTG-motif cell wall-anchored protein